MPPKAVINSSINQLQLNKFRNWVHKEKWWITASDILKDHSSDEWIHLTNKNPTGTGIGNRKDAGWETGWNSPLSDYRIDQIVEDSEWEVSFERSRNPGKQALDLEKAPESAA